MFKRTLLGVSLYRSDREHIHHFFLDNNYSKGQSLMIVTMIGIFLTFFGMILEISQIAEYISFYLFIASFIVWSILSSNLKKRFEK
jgi:UDP-GlcNAc:undecaprenyl-phosphate GlcNAc-1-phosphate transferase